MGDEPDVIEQQIAETRERMTDTVEMLAQKTDVAARVQENVPASAGDAARSAVDWAGRHPGVVVAGVVALSFLAGRLSRRH